MRTVQVEQTVYMYYDFSGKPAMLMRRVCFLVLFFQAVITGCQTQPKVSYSQDVYPILARNCIECHRPPDGKGFVKTGLNMESYETLMAGTFYGPVIVPGDSRKSILNMLIEQRADDSMRMPHNSNEPLKDHEVRLVQLWVRQGAHNN